LQVDHSQIIDLKLNIMAKARKHPKGLEILFFTEMWERFGFYLMLGIFTLYMIAPGSGDFPGLGLSNMEAADIYGTYLALVYLTPFFGGLLADRLLGYRKSIYIGGVLMAAGYIGLSVPNNMLIFYISLLLIILGNGLFKPNVSVLLGKLYEKPEYIHLKDSGYNIFYMGINIGAFVCNFVAAYLRLTFGWGWAFAAAGIGMLVGLVWFAYGNIRVPEIKEADKITPARKEDMSLGRIFTVLFIPAIVAAAIGWLIPNNIFGSDSNDAFIFFCIPVLIFFYNI
jgi:POT family proton-dependent oligopeptide transporter